MANKALVVDDNFYNRDLARLALENTEFTVIAEAENGIDALQMLERDVYDLLILDLAMPELDGIGVLNELRKDPRCKHMTIVVVTAHAHLAGSIELDVDFVLYKPIDINSFRTFLQRLKPAQRIAG